MRSDTLLLSYLQARTLNYEPTVRAFLPASFCASHPCPCASDTPLSAVNSEYRERRKDAIKRVIANMTVGKDVSGLFPDVLKNMQTEDLEQKKLVYLYLMNYAKTQPELVILAVNTFVKVSCCLEERGRGIALCRFY